MALRLWTVQDPNAWEMALLRGYLSGSEEHIPEEFRPAYDWMRQQMRARLPAYSGDWPIWAWTTRPGLRRGGHAPRGAQMVLLSVEVPPERVLLSDFQAWHFVLNGWYLPLDEADDERRERNPPTPEEVRASWERIFTPEALSGYVAPSGVMQACVDRVYVSEVRQVRPFVAR